MGRARQQPHAITVSSQRRLADGFVEVLGASRGLSSLQRQERERASEGFYVGDTDGVVTISYYRDNDPVAAVLHRGEGPALVITTPDTQMECYYRDGELDREDGPAIVETMADGTRITQYCHRGELDRADGPAHTELRANGDLFEEYYSHGVRHRQGGPAQIHTLTDGSHLEFYYDAGQQHREDGPAIIEDITGDDDGDHLRGGGHFEKYYLRGQLHREDGPALIERRTNGASKEEWYRHGVKTAFKLRPAHRTFT